MPDKYLAQGPPTPQYTDSYLRLLRQLVGLKGEAAGFGGGMRLRWPLLIGQ